MGLGDSKLRVALRKPGNSAPSDAHGKGHYSGFDTAVKFAHIHFGQFGVGGGVAAFLCGGGKPACPPSGEVTGTITASDVVGPAAQGIAPGEIDELIAAMRHGVTYANIHTDAFGDGEIRGQIGGRGDHAGFGRKGRHGGGGTATTTTATSPSPRPIRAAREARASGPPFIQRCSTTAAPT
jgi:hypothetical protein